MRRTIAIMGEYSPTFGPHAATNAAILHSRARVDADVDVQWVSTESIDASIATRWSGLWIAPGSPYKDMDKALLALRLGREWGIPCFGTCGGFQHMVIEYARNVLGFEDAQHAEYDPYASRLFVSRLACSLAGRKMTLRFTPGSQVGAIYGGLSAVEEYYCDFGVNPDCASSLRGGPLLITGSDEEGDVRVIELPGHPFYIGTLFVPQTRSTPAKPHPLVTAFLEAVERHAS